MSTPAPSPAPPPPLSQPQPQPQTQTQPQPQPQPRKVPPPCWTHDETLALIEAYRDRWLSLRRGYLRTADWDAVCAAVSGRCRHLSVSPAKSSAQCRHKIEKLRQRYRAERQRCIAFPGKFFSSWVFFKKLDFIDGGSSSAVAGSDQATKKKIGSGGRFRVKSIGDPTLMDLGFAGSKNSGTVDEISDLNADFDHDFDGDVGFRVKAPSDRSAGFIGSKNYGKIDANSNPNFDHDHDVGPRIGFFVNSHGDRSSVPPPGFKAKKNGNFEGKFNPNLAFNHETYHDGFDAGGEFSQKTFGDQIPMPLRFRSNDYSNKINKNAVPVFDLDHDEYDRIDAGAAFRVKPPGFRSKNSYNMDGDSHSKLDSSLLNGSSSASRLKFAKKSGNGGGGGGVKREMDPILEIVSSIKLLGEGFINMEKMKMDMAMEIEKMRMEMEMKRNEMILESQRQIVDAFLKVLVEKKNKKVKVMVSPDS